MTWDQAAAFCQWLTARDQASRLIPAGAAYRLPTDVEWSRLAGLADETGADPEQRGASTAPAHYPWSAEGTFPPPAMSTNLDAPRIPGYADAFTCTASVTAEAASPLGLQGLGGNVAEWCADAWPGAPEERVVRGGSWKMSRPEDLLTRARRHAAKTSISPDIGFRVVLKLGGQ